jgi:hypothetical protein
MYSKLMVQAVAQKDAEGPSWSELQTAMGDTGAYGARSCPGSGARRQGEDALGRQCWDCLPPHMKKWAETTTEYGDL